mmetsp:Transcript_18587/g.47084  ORF Transcript_18587/g.47084 Transcript_18587/m.47084 type:complete len:253 (-) Transcript_18587:719-1477(-)
MTVRHVPLASSQMRSDSSSEPDTARRESGVTASAYTASLWPISVARHAPLATSHRRSVVSVEPVMTWRPSRVNPTAYTGPVWPSSTRSSVAVEALAPPAPPRGSEVEGSSGVVASSSVITLNPASAAVTAVLSGEPPAWLVALRGVAGAPAGLASGMGRRATGVTWRGGACTAGCEPLAAGLSENSCASVTSASHTTRAGGRCAGSCDRQARMRRCTRSGSVAGMAGLSPEHTLTQIWLMRSPCQGGSPVAM